MNELLSVQYARNRAQISTKTYKSQQSHLRLFKRNNINVLDEDNDYFMVNANQKLDRLVDKKGQRLKLGYKIQLAMTIKRLFPLSDISIKKYKLIVKNEPKFYSVDFVEKLKQMMNHASAYLRDRYANADFDVTFYDVALAIMLSTCTALRIEELHQLKLSHIEQIRKFVPINIKTKNSYANRVISPNSILLKTLTLIQTQRERIRIKLQQSMLQSREQKKFERYDQEYLLLSSVSFMGKRLKEFCALHSVHLPTIGFNSFRKLITTLLIERGGHTVAQTLNNHSNLNTTINNYAIASAETSNTLYTDLKKRMDSMSSPLSQQERSSTVQSQVIRPRQRTMSTVTTHSVGMRADRQSTIPQQLESIEEQHEPISQGDDDFDMELGVASTSSHLPSFMMTPQSVILE